MEFSLCNLVVVRIPCGLSHVMSSTAEWGLWGQSMFALKAFRVRRKSSCARFNLIGKNRKYSSKTGNLQMCWIVRSVSHRHARMRLVLDCEKNDSTMRAATTTWLLELSLGLCSLSVRASSLQYRKPLARVCLRRCPVLIVIIINIIGSQFSPGHTRFLLC